MGTIAACNRRIDSLDGIVRTVLYIAAPNDLPQLYPYSNIDTSYCGANKANWDSNDNGLFNTNAIISQTGHVNSAALGCNNYSVNGYSDWYLGSTNEVKYMLEEADIVNSVSLANNGSSLTGLFSPETSYWQSTESLSSPSQASTRIVTTNYGVTKSFLANVRPQKTISIAPTLAYPKGSFAFGGVVFKVSQLTY